MRTLSQLISLLASLVLPVVTVAQTTAFIDVSAGDMHTCAVTDKGAALCWGLGAWGQLGSSSSSIILGSINGYITTPIEVDGLNSGVSAISAGYATTCAIVNGGAKCWGGTVGNGSSERFPTPQDVFGLSSGVSLLSTGFDRGCAVVNGAVKCWGKEPLGDGGFTSSSTPVRVYGLNSGVNTISTGAQACAVTTNGELKCWGTLHYTMRYYTPETVLTSGVSAVSSGSNHNCAIVNGGAKCWGHARPENAPLLGSGYNGDGPDYIEKAPIDVIGLQNGVTAISAGNYQTCVIVNGGVKCWGKNTRGQLGVGNTVEASISHPVDVIGLDTGILKVASGRSHVCALTNCGSIVCWGDNKFGQLGNGTSDNYLSEPFPIKYDQPNSTLRCGTSLPPDYQRVMNWAESLFPQFFPTQGKQEMEIAPFHVRYYPGSNTYLGYNPTDNRFYGYNPAAWGPAIVPFGLLNEYLPSAAQAGF